MSDQHAIRVVQWPICQDVDTEDYYVATDVSGDRRTSKPQTWYLAQIEPLENMMMRAAMEADDE